jgi:hypothetical protein
MINVTFYSRSAEALLPRINAGAPTKLLPRLHQCGSALAVAGKSSTLVGYRRAIRTGLLERDLEPLAIEHGEIKLPLTAKGFSAVRLLP